MIVDVARNTDVLSLLGAALVFAQDFGDTRHFARADKKIHFGQFFGEFIRVPLGEAAGDNKFFNPTGFFQAAISRLWCRWILL